MGRTRSALAPVVVASLALACAVPRCAAAAAIPVDVDRLPDGDAGLPGDGPMRHADWFRSAWNERHAAWSKRVDQDQGAVVFVGDAITQNWGDTFGGSFQGWKVANRGIDGDTTRGILFRLDHDVLRLHPRAVVILAGTNDLEDHADAATVAGNVRLVVQELEASNRTLPIFLCELFPSSAATHVSKERIAETNRRYDDLAQSDRRITLVPTWSIFADDNGDVRASEFPDLLHPNAAGYARWAGLLRPMLARAVPPEPVRDR